MAVCPFIKLPSNLRIYQPLRSHLAVGDAVEVAWHCGSKMRWFGGTFQGHRPSVYLSHLEADFPREPSVDYNVPVSLCQVTHQGVTFELLADARIRRAVGVEDKTFVTPGEAHKMLYFEVTIVEQTGSPEY